jgi:hypothetical protein
MATKDWTPLLADSLGGRSAGAGKRCQFSAGNGCEGPQPSRPPPISVATNEWPWLADSLQGVRSVGAVQRCLFSAGNGCEGPQTFYRFSRDILCKLVAINSELGGLEL